MIPRRDIIYLASLSRRRLLKYGFYGGLSVGLAPYLWLSGCERKSRNSRPSVILITVDTLRADHLSCYGYQKNTSPNIDQFSKDALLFENCLSHAPVTSSSFASMLSGYFPHETKVFANLSLPKEVRILPELLKPYGYKTAAVVSNYALRKKKGWAHKFETYDDTLNVVRHIPERIAEHTTNTSIKLLRQFSKDQLFMWIHYQDPHGPYIPPASYNEMFKAPARQPRELKLNTKVSGYGGIPSYQQLGTNRGYSYYVSQYDGEIRYMDEQFKRLLDVLKEHGLYDDALIIFTSDHGEGMGEHNYYFAHGENLYHNLLHVPLIVKYGKQSTGRRLDFVQHLDIVPTILKTVGLKTNSSLRGRDLFEQDLQNREIFAEMNSPRNVDGIKFSVVIDGLKLIYTQLNEQYQLFDLKTDRLEERNLINKLEYQKHAKDLKASLRRIASEDLLGLDIANKPRKLTRDEIEKLRSLGYVDYKPK